jgi:hypothetical protein
MAEVVIDEAQLNAMQAASKLLEQLNSDPKTRKHLTAAIKHHYPNTRTEEDIAEEYAAPIREEVKASLSEVRDMLQRLHERDQRESEHRTLAQLDQSFNKLRSTYGYNDDGIDKIKSLMVDRSIPDPEAAAALYERLNPAPVETRSSWEPDGWNLREDAVATDVQGLFSDPDRWADKEVGKILLDVRNQNRA